MHTKEIIMITLIVLTMIFTSKTVLASTNTYYLEKIGDKYVLTTQTPDNPFVSVGIGPGGTYNNTWYSDPIGGITINAGTYTFTFWMDGTWKGVVVTVTFAFGYYYAGKHYQIVKTSGNFQLLMRTTNYTLGANNAKSVNIPEGSQLYLTVSISNNDPEHNANFYYSGSRYRTNISTPQIAVPEFPMGFFCFYLCFLTVYFIVRRRIYGA